MRHTWPASQPQPTTAIKGPVVPFGFEDCRAVRSGSGADAVKRAFELNKGIQGPSRKYGMKPKRNSKGVIWSGKAFYWSAKGYYRPGKGNTRRPLHHLIWEAHSGQQMKRMYEVIFKDDNRHNFRPGNLVCMHKAEVHRRIIDLGRSGNKYTKTAKERLQLMLKRFGQKESNEYKNEIQWLGQRRKQTSPQVCR